MRTFRRHRPRYERNEPQKYDCTDNRCQQAPDGTHRNPSDKRDQPPAQYAADKSDDEIDYEARSAPPDNLARNPSGEKTYD